MDIKELGGIPAILLGFLVAAQGVPANKLGFTLLPPDAGVLFIPINAIVAAIVLFFESPPWLGKLQTLLNESVGDFVLFMVFKLAATAAA